MEFLFWILLSIILYTYLGYPLLLYIKSCFKRYPVSKSYARQYPHVSIVIAARNEGASMKRRIHNIIEQDYPKEKLEIIIISDGSKDNTQNVLQSMRHEILYLGKDFLRIFHHKSSLGKPSCINKGVMASNGDIIVFGDCRQRFAKNAIKQLIRFFFDPKIGCVSGELVFEEASGSSIQAEIGSYWRFEKWVRKLESATGSVPGATGAIYAMRKRLFRPLPAKTLLDDVLLPMYVCMQGYRTVFESKAIAYDTISKDVRFEKKRKIRTLAGNWQLLFLEPAFLNPLKNPIWVRFISHKIFRLLIPYLFIFLVIVALVLRDFYSLLFLAAVAFSSFFSILPLPGRRFRSLSRFAGIVRSIIMLNYFAFLAPFKLLFSSKKLW